METAISYLTVLPSAKQEVQEFTRQILSQVESGEINALDLKVRLKWLERLIKAIDEPIKEAVSNEALKNGRNFDYRGFKIQYSENISPKYDYTNCNDPKWNELDEMIKKLGEQKKDREAFLKSIQGYVEVVDEITGEMIPVIAPTKKASTGIIMEAI